jgi:hypothetical protein
MGMRAKESQQNRRKDIRVSATAMHNPSSLETAALIDLTISLVDELIRRDKTEPTHLYVVNGIHADEAPQITADFVAATGEEEAALRVERVRVLCSDGWTHDLTYLHLADIWNAITALKRPLTSHTDDLKMILSEFGGNDCLSCQKSFSEDDLA